MVRVDAAIRQDDEVVARRDGFVGLAEQIAHGAFEAVNALLGEQDRQRDRLEAAALRAVEIADFVQFIVAQDRRRQLDLPGSCAAPARAGCTRGRWSYPST